MNDPNEPSQPEPNDEHREQAVRRLLADPVLPLEFCSDTGINPFVLHALYDEYGGTPLRNGSLSDDWLRDEWETYMNEFMQKFTAWLPPDRIDTMAYNIMTEEIEASKQAQADYIRESREEVEELPF